VTGLADNPSPALLRVERPMFKRQTASVHVDGEAASALAGGERGAETDHQWGEAAIEADGEETGGRTRDRHGRIEIRFSERERFFDPDRFTGDQRRPGKCTMLIMSGGDEDGGDQWVVK